MDRTITQVNFTWSIPGGLWVRRGSEQGEWIDMESLVAEVGAAEARRLQDVAYHNGMTGMWYNARNGGNVYANGQEVNA